MHRAEPNPWIGLNYIPDNENVATPPPYVLRQLWDFDSMLVMMPSRYVPFAYVLARRKQFSKGLTDKALEETITQPDTRLCLQHGLVPVTLIYKIGQNWNFDKVIADLRARDTWSFKADLQKSLDAAADQLDANDAENEARIKKQIRDDMWNRSGDAWRSYQARTGQRTAYRQGGARTERRTYNKLPSGSTVGSGAIASRD